MTLKKYDTSICTVFIWLGIGTSGGYCEHGNEKSESMNVEKLLAGLRNC
jgi:hypothetical protein